MPVLRVMSFNVFTKDPSDFPDDASAEELDDGWSLRAGLNVSCIKRYRPHLVGLQEMNDETHATYLRELPEYTGTDPMGYATHVPSIFWRARELELVDQGHFYLSGNPAVPSADWGVEYPLGVSWVRLRLREGGRDIVHMNTQFEDGPGGAQSRLESSRLMVERGAMLQQQGEGRVPLVVTGDFNCNPWSEPYHVFLDAGFTDTYRAAGHGDSATSSTFHAFRGEDYFALDYGSELFWRVDWILTRDGDQPVRTTSCTIVRHAYPALYPSDHYPVVTELLLRVPDAGPR
jgi:endonuclease/exonuclease/phosphatase family metal-dependent hydrolase